MFHFKTKNYFCMFRLCFICSPNRCHIFAQPFIHIHIHAFWINSFDVNLTSCQLHRMKRCFCNSCRISMWNQMYSWRNFLGLWLNYESYFFLFLQLCKLMIAMKECVCGYANIEWYCSAAWASSHDWIHRLEIFYKLMTHKETKSLNAESLTTNDDYDGRFKEEKKREKRKRMEKAKHMHISPNKSRWN